jgi:hypothetical protein
MSGPCDNARMDDTVRTTAHHVTSHGTQRGTHRGVTVHEAAAALGLTPEAVRARLRRGTLNGYKADDDTWRVRLPDDASLSNLDNEGRQSPPDDAHHTVTDVTQPVRDGTHHDTSHGAQRDVPDDALVTHLQEEVIYLRMRLEDAMGQLAEERRRADVLRLSASVSEPPNDHDHTVEGSTENAPQGILARLRAWIAGRD